MAFLGQIAAQKRADELNKIVHHDELNVVRYEPRRNHVGEWFVGKFIEGMLDERIYE